MTQLKRFLCALVLAALAAGPQALSQGQMAGEACSLSLQAPAQLTWRGPFSRGYDDRAALVHAERVPVEIRSRGGPCAYQLDIRAVDDSYELRSGAGRLAYGLSAGAGAQAGPLQLDGEAGPGIAAEPAGFLVEVTPGQLVPAGVYSAPLQLRLYRMDEGRAFLADTALLTVTAEVLPRVSAAIGPEPGTGRTDAVINIGQLRGGVPVAMTFSVSANTPYDIQLSSAHDGAFRHLISGTRLPYELRLDGALVDLAGKAAHLRSGSGQPVRQHDLSLTVGKTKGAPAGAYQDQLTLTISAR